MSNAVMEGFDQCCTSAEFSLSAILGKPLNLTAGTTNDLIWALHDSSYLTGYQDPANFNRAFRRSQHQSPQKYRRELAAEA